MMRISRASALALGLVLAAPATDVEAQDDERPKLVVALVVDQLRADLVEHYAPALTDGFVRLAREGLSFSQTSHAHARTSTAPGHATLATGVFPSRHAVVANSWQQRVGGRWTPMYAVADTASRIVGYENIDALEGRSPANMIREALPDWMLAADPDTRVVSISKKDRAAIPMGGKNAEHVYWMVPETGRFVTSHYYRDREPGWLRDFNDDVMPQISAGKVWESDAPESVRHLARPDSASYEGDGVHTTFPHRSEEESPTGDPADHNLWVYDQSRADLAVMRLVEVAMRELDLGQRDEQDYLAVSFSATDRVGHAYGPYGQEQLSNLVHLDGLLGDFFRLLDEHVGEGRWVLGFSADHGVVTIPEAQVEMGTNPEARRIPQNELFVEIGAAVREAGGGGAPEAVAERIAEIVEERGLVAGAYTHHELTRGMPADSFAVLFRNSHYPGRAWGPLSRFGVEVRFGDGDLVGFSTGTNHESTYWYDRWVPMVFLGAGVPSGVSDGLAYTVDFAPTLAALAGIPAPDDLDGRTLY